MEINKTNKRLQEWEHSNNNGNKKVCILYSHFTIFMCNSLCNDIRMKVILKIKVPTKIAHMWISLTQAGARARERESSWNSWVRQHLHSFAILFADCCNSCRILNNIIPSKNPQNNQMLEIMEPSEQTEQWNSNCRIRACAPMHARTLKRISLVVK